MKKLKIISIPILLMFLCSCSTSSGGSTSNNSEPTSTTTSEVSEGSTITSSEKIWEKYVSNRNPMSEPKVNRQFYLNHIGDIYNTWKSLEGHGQTIAVIDVGFKYDHEDFTYEDGTSKVSDKSASFRIDGNQVITEVDKTKLGVTALDLQHDGWYNNSHGTFCAGVAAAGINGKGVIGIAPLAELMLLKTDGHPLSICEAFKYAADNGARVISISIGSYSDYEGDLYWSKSSINLTSVFNDAVNYCRGKGTVVISAAGNGGGSSRATEYTYPGATPGVIGSGGLEGNSSSERWSGSSYNSSSQYMFCDVFAPSHAMFGCSDYSPYYDGGSDDWKGTSFAAPIVAGMAALYFERYPNNSVDQFEADLYASCNGFGSTIQNGYGRVDVGRLLNTTYSGNVTIKAKDSTQLYAYVWNSKTDIKEKDYPGNACSLSGGYYTYTVDTSKYDFIVISDGSAQTIDLLVTSFMNGNTYDVSSPLLFKDNRYIGYYL